MKNALLLTRPLGLMQLQESAQVAWMDNTSTHANKAIPIYNNIKNKTSQKQ